jgi:H/ACA ribonucleoprotein complex subunit 4
MDSKIKFGIINIDKPSGPTSFSVSSYLAKQLKLNKASHLGTLDPKVTGVLPVALGRACKLTRFFMSHDKGYVGILHTHEECHIKELQTLIDKHFTGKIKQTPPHKSAVKRAEREREVYSWKLIEASETKKDFLFECVVEGGTYIRKLCSDLGEMVGGAHMAELRRNKAGIFTEEKMYTLFEFQKALELYKKGKKQPLHDMIVPAEDAITKVMPVINVEKRVLTVLLTGKPLFYSDVIDKEEFSKIAIGEVFAVFIDNNFVEVAKKVANEELVAKSEFVYN